jgi:hypothetical protein
LAPWKNELLQIIEQCSTNSDFRAYDLVAELETRALFEVTQLLETSPVVYRQSVEQFIESLHSRNGLSQDRMGAEVTASFDRRVLDVVSPYARSDVLEVPVIVRVAIGRPIPLLH